MATIITDISESKIMTNLDTYNYTAQAAGMYIVSCAISEIPVSGITIALKQNGSTKASVAAPASTQSVQQLQVIMNCDLNDVIGVTIASSVAQDNQINDFKALINIRQGTI